MFARYPLVACWCVLFFHAFTGLVILHLFSDDFNNLDFLPAVVFIAALLQSSIQHLK